MLLEVIVTTIQEALQAEQYGANRLELIHEFALGGLSPGLTLSKEICNEVNIPVNIMLRPHGKNFIYDKADIKTIMAELDYLRDHTKANAVVFGALTSQNQIDHKLLQQIIDCKHQLKLTFHRAIDVTPNPLMAYQELLAYPDIENILTSGGKETALLGVDIIRQMQQCNTNLSHATIIAGSGITIHNVNAIITQTHVTQIHVGQGLRINNILSPIKFKQLHANYASCISTN